MNGKILNLSYYSIPLLLIYFHKLRWATIISLKIDQLLPNSLKSIPVSNYT